jgi:AcrR family transcriptional regulator
LHVRFEQTTVNEIAAAVCVSARKFLRYFPTKEDVMVAWVAEVMAVLPKSLAARPAGESPDEALKAAAREMLESYEARAKFFLSIERVIAGSPPYDIAPWTKPLAQRTQSRAAESIVPGLR